MNHIVVSGGSSIYVNVHVCIREQHEKQLVSRSTTVHTNLPLTLRPPSWTLPVQEHGHEFEIGDQ